MPVAPRLLVLLVGVSAALVLTGPRAAAEDGDGDGSGDDDPEASRGLDDPAAALPASTEGLGSHDPAIYGPFRLSNGLVLPYPLDNVFRGFAECRRGGHRHPALDIGGVGPAWGLGTPVWSMARARVTAIGTPEDDPERFGKRVTRRDKVFRGRRWLPSSAVLPDYGQVWFFTGNYGRSRTGVYVTTRVLEGRLKDHSITYMHLAALHPAVRLGEVVEAGQELGAMGGTAVLDSAPHVHIGVHTAAGTPLDVGPLLEIGPTRAPCRTGKRGQGALRAQYSKNADRLMETLRREAKRTVEPAGAPTRCGVWSVEERFVPVGKERVVRHRFPVPGVASANVGPTTIRVERLAGRWQPKLALEDAGGKAVWSGARASRAETRRYGLRDAVSGRRAGVAEVTLAPQGERSVSAVVSAWGGKAPPRGAHYRLTVTRPCGPGDSPVGGPPTP